MNHSEGDQVYRHQYPDAHQVQRVGTTYNRVRLSKAWHATHITLTCLTGGLWGFVYLARYLKHTAVRRETSHY